MATIARLAGVAPSTVSRVLNGKSGVSMDTRRRVEELLREQGYRRAATRPPSPIVELVFYEMHSHLGVEIVRGVQAVVEQLCSVTLDPFEQPASGEIAVQVVPRGSPNAQPEEGHEAEYDPEGPDPPDVLPGEAIDLAGYVVEHLALEIDPFPRKPGAEFEFAPPPAEESPFAVLKKLKGDKP